MRGIHLLKTDPESFLKIARKRNKAQQNIKKVKK